LHIENEASGSLGNRMMKIEVNLIRGQIVKRLMGALRVAKPKPLFKAPLQHPLQIPQQKYRIPVTKNYLRG
jgi:hypothetical protein